MKDERRRTKRPRGFFHPSVLNLSQFPYHTPTLDGKNLKRAQRHTFKQKSQHADNDYAGVHDVGSEKRARLEDAKADAGADGSKHLAGHQDAPGARKALAITRNDRRERGGQQDLVEKRITAGTQRPPGVD